MTLKGKITGFRNYSVISKKLAEVKNKSYAKVLSRNIWSRLLFSISPTFPRPYSVLYGLTEKSVSQEILLRVQNCLTISKLSTY